MSLYDEANKFGSWDDDSIWSLGAPPDASQDAFIGGPGSFRVTSDDDVTVNSVGVAYDEELNIAGGTLTATNGTVLGADDQGHSYGIDGIVYVENNANFSIGNALVNFGTVFVGGATTGAAPGTMKLTGSVTFDGVGEVLLGSLGEASNKFSAGDITGDSLTNDGETIAGTGLIDLTSLDNAAGTIIAEHIGESNLNLQAATFTNEATVEIRTGATLYLGDDSATWSMTNTGTVSIGYYDGFANSAADATLAIRGNYTINGDGRIVFGGDDESIVSDGAATGATFTNGSASSIHANFTGRIGNGAANLTFDNYGDVYATDDGVTLTIYTGANTDYDIGGLLEADDNGTLVIDSPTQMGQYYFLLGSGSPPPGGTIEATGGGTVEIASTVANGPPSHAERESLGEVVADEGSTVVIEAGGAVSVAIVIDDGIVSVDAGGAATGSIAFDGVGGELEFGASNTTTGEISGYQSGDTIVIYGFDIHYQPADPHEALPSAFTLSRADDVVTQTNADGSTQVTTYAINGQSFTQKAIDTNADGQVVAKYFSGVTGEGDLSAFEYLYAGNNLVGTNEFYSGITGQAYTNQEIDYNGAGQLVRDAFSGVTGASYSSYEYDYVGGVFAGAEFSIPFGPLGSHDSYELDYDHNDAFTGEKIFYPDVTGQSYTGEEVDYDADLNLSRVVLTGVENEAYSSLELDYTAGTYAGYKAYYKITGQAYTNEEVDVSASDTLEKAIYSGLTGTPYQTLEQDYSNGAPANAIYGYTDVTGQTYNAYQLVEDAGGDPLQETFDLNSGGHTLVALSGGQTLTSLGNDKMIGDGPTTFVLDAIYGADLITNFTSDDMISLPSSEFTNFGAVTGAATQSGSNVLITAADGDTLTLKGLTTTELAQMSGNFTFHA